MEMIGNCFDTCAATYEFSIIREMCVCLKIVTNQLSDFFYFVGYCKSN